MPRNKNIIICTSKNNLDATKISNLLEKNGIISILRSVTSDSLLASRRQEPVMVQIDEKDYNEAKMILK